MSAGEVLRLDPELEPFLRAGQAEEDRALESLIQGVEPVIRGIIRRKATLFSGSAGGRGVTREAELGEDLYCAAVLRLLEQLQRLKSRVRSSEAEGDSGGAAWSEARQTASGTIHSFQGLAETVTRNLVNEYLRQKYPHRTSLRNQIVYLIRHYQESRTGKLVFALWEAGRERACGFLEWLGQALVVTYRHRKVRDDPQSFVRDALPHGDTLGPNLAELLASLFRWLGAPMELDETVGTIARLRGVEDRPDASLQQPTESGEETGVTEPPGSGPTPEEQTMMRHHLDQIWSAICRLPPNQCAALLLNLTDERGKGVVDLLPALGIASVRQIAAAMEMPAERLAEIWPCLPLEDQAISELLNCPASRVAVWRFRARQKLQAAVPVSPVS